MSSVTFNFARYDIGGQNANAAYNKLTGIEVSIARSAGWDVKEGYTLEMGTPKQIKNEKNDKEFFKFTDDKNNFSWKETGVTALRVILSPLMLLCSCGDPNDVNVEVNNNFDVDKFVKNIKQRPDLSEQEKKNTINNFINQMPLTMEQRSTLKERYLK